MTPIWDRRLPRIAYQVPVHVLLVDQKVRLAARTRNVSEGGMFVETASALAIGQAVRCNLALDHRPTTLCGRVAWLHRGDGPMHEGRGAGIEFVDLRDDDCLLLRRVVGQSEEDSYPVRLWFGDEAEPMTLRAVITPTGILVSAPLPFLKLDSTVRFAFVGGAADYRGKVARVQVSSNQGQPTPRLHLEVELDEAELLREREAAFEAAPTAPLPPAIPRPGESDRHADSDLIQIKVEDDRPLQVSGTIPGARHESADEFEEDTPPARPSQLAAALGHVRARAQSAPLELPEPPEPSRRPSFAPIVPPLPPPPMTPESVVQRVRALQDRRDDERRASEARLRATRRAIHRRRLRLAALFIPVAAATAASVIVGLAWMDGRFDHAALLATREPATEPTAEPAAAAAEPAAAPVLATVPATVSAPVPATAAEPDAIDVVVSPAELARPSVVAADGRTEVVVPIEGSLAGLKHYPLAGPDGIALILPAARARIPFGDYPIALGRVRMVWLRGHDGGVQIRIFTRRGIPRYDVAAAPDAVRVTVRRQNLELAPLEPPPLESPRLESPPAE